MRINRVGTILGICIVFEFLIIGRLVELQIVRSKGFKVRVKEQSEARIKIISKRGKILDRRYRILATTINRRERREDKLAWERGERVYPFEEVGGNLIGFVGKDKVGLEGVEYEFDPLLSGVPGWMTLGKKPRGSLYPYPGLPKKIAKSAYDIVLTIDADIEGIIEAMLSKRVQEVGAKCGYAVVINPQSGEILAMANVPGSNPMKWRKEKNWKNWVIQDQFEPGSTFKIVPLSLIIRDSLVALGDIVEDGAGEIRIGGHIIHDVRPHEAFTFAEAVWHSSNVAFVKLGKLIGRGNLYAGTRIFGFGSPTGIHLPGEAKGKIERSSNWSEVRFANISFGQGLSCTLLQLAFAYQAIANKGILLQPQIIKEVLSNPVRRGLSNGANEKIIYRAKPQKVREVLSAEKAKEVIELLCGVIEKGSGMYACIPGLRIAGKTGTAQKADAGKYRNKYLASFIAFFPAEEPELLIACVIDEPRKGHLGGEVCGPFMKAAIGRIINLKQYRHLVME